MGLHQFRVLYTRCAAARFFRCLPVSSKKGAAFGRQSRSCTRGRSIDHCRIPLRELFLRWTMDDDKPCCAADALRRIRQVKINGIMTGITMLDESIAAVKEQNLRNELEIHAALMKKIRIYNYIPKGVEAEYERALIEEYKKAIAKK